MTNTHKVIRDGVALMGLPYAYDHPSQVVSAVAYGGQYVVLAQHLDTYKAYAGFYPTAEAAKEVAGKVTRSRKYGKFYAYAFKAGAL